MIETTHISTGTKARPLRVKLQSEAIKEARAEITENRTGRPLCLKTRWESVNRAMLGGFRFNNNVLLAGLSGHGKSYLVNLLLQDFRNPLLNGDFPGELVFLHFNFEMSSADEILRTVSSDTGTSYGELISAEKPLDDMKFQAATAVLDTLEAGKPPLYYVENSGNRFEILDTIDYVHKLHPKAKLVILLDHVLLLDYLDEATEVELLEKWAKMLIHIRKTYGGLVITVGQLNDKIMDPRRREPAMQFPMMTDIHGSKQIYHAVDTVLVVHRPELLNIAPTYGPGSGFPTSHLLALHVLKMRKGKIGVVPLSEDFEHGLISEFVSSGYQL